MSSEPPAPDQSPGTPSSVSVSDPFPTITRCPVCRYSLEGLPSAHRCPECGFQYDEQTRVWEPKSFMRYGALVLILLGSQIGNMMVQFSQSHYGVAAFFVAGYTFAIAFTIAAYRRRPFVAVTPVGVVFRRIFKEVSVPWKDIARVCRGGKLRMTAVITKQPECKTHAFHNNILPTKEAIGELAEVIEAQWKAYNAAE